MDDVFRGADQFQGEGDVFGNRPRREEVEVLENHADIFAFCPKLGFAHFAQVFVVDDDFAAGRFFQHIDAADEGRFAGTALADDAEDLAVFDGQVDAL